MRLFEKSSILEGNCESVFGYHLAPLALRRLIPPWEKVEVQENEPGIFEGCIKSLQLRPFAWMPWVRVGWKAEHQNFQPPHQFEDIQSDGPMRHWIHRHLCESIDSDHARLTDRIEFEAKGPKWGSDRIEGWVESQLQTAFSYRHQLMQQDMVLHAWMGRPEPARIAITGATGLVGQRLASLLSVLGHDVWPVFRRNAHGEISGQHSFPPLRDKFLIWSPENGIEDRDRWEGLDACIHLAGKNIAAARWTTSFKRELFQSRVDATKRLSQQLAGLNHPPKAFVSASAVGIYGDQGEAIVTESTGPSSSFLGELAKEWERASRSLEDRGIRTTHARLAMVLSSRDGALARMLPLFRCGLGGKIGNGQQWWSWIDVEDAASILYWMAFDGRACGAFNGVAPEVVRNAEFTKCLAKTMNRMAVLPAPAFALRWMLGAMAEPLLLASCRAVPQRLEEVGFPFRFAMLKSSLVSQLG